MNSLIAVKNFDVTHFELKFSTNPIKIKLKSIMNFRLYEFGAIVDSKSATLILFSVCVT